MHFNSTSDTIIALAAPQQIKLQVQSHLVVLSLFWETKILHPPKLAAEPATAAARQPSEVEATGRLTLSAVTSIARRPG